MTLKQPLTVARSPAMTSEAPDPCLGPRSGSDPAWTVLEAPSLMPKNPNMRRMSPLQARNRMVAGVKGMIIDLAVHYSPEGSDRDDLISAGWQAAAEAARTYDPSKGKYSTWAYWKIRQGMQTQMRLRWVTSASYWVRGQHGAEEREPIFEETCEDSRPTPLEELCNEERASEAHYALALLSKRFSKSEIKAICMYFLDGRGIRSIAKVVHHPQELVHRARQAMAEVRESLSEAPETASSSSSAA